MPRIKHYHTFTWPPPYRLGANPKFKPYDLEKYLGSCYCGRLCEIVGKGVKKTIRIVKGGDSS